VFIRGSKRGHEESIFAHRGLSSIVTNRSAATSRTMSVPPPIHFTWIWSIWRAGPGQNRAVSQVALVTAPAMHLVDLGQVPEVTVTRAPMPSRLFACPEAGPGSSDWCDWKHFSGSWAHAGIEYNHIDPAVVIQIIESGAALLSLAAVHRHIVRHIYELTRPVFRRTYLGVVTGGVIKLFHVIDKVSAGNKDVRWPSLSKSTHQCPNDIRVCAGARPGLPRHILIKCPPLFW